MTTDLIPFIVKCLLTAISLGVAVLTIKYVFDAWFSLSILEKILISALVIVLVICCIGLIITWFTAVMGGVVA